ncbi:twin-arginine translocation signal domain-containing protein [Streptomyces sp. NPDC051322]|uniref:twin-arginine translocation signal domain-containing protein n=1 Tax=Streptomyces sp. NPDC051322 TaxID=3154645 RepID=UPI0034501721
MTEQSRRSFLRQVSVGGAVVGAAAFVPGLPARPTPAHAGPRRDGAAAPGAAYGIDISMSAQTTGVLTAGLYQLLVFKAVQSAASGGAPTLWASIGNYSEETRLSWTEQYFAFASTQQDYREARSGGVAAMPIASGQTLAVGPGAVGTVVDSGGSPGSITVRNTTADPFTCGLAQPSPDGGPTMPLCAFPLRGKSPVAIKPLRKVALVFVAGPVRPGSVVRSPVGRTVLVDLTRAHSAELSYDINAGWSWKGAVAAETVANTSFTSRLVVAGPA